MHGRCHRGSHAARLRATRRPCGACAARPSHLGTRRTGPAFEFAARIPPRSTSRLQRDDPVLKTRAPRTPASERKSVVTGQSVLVSVDLGGSRFIKTKKKT